MSSFQAMLEACRAGYPVNGAFRFETGDLIRKRAREEKIPTVPGVYVVFGEKAGQLRCLYVGCSGTMGQDGTFGDQTLPQRLWKNQNKTTKRQEFWTAKIAEMELDALVIKWFGTFHGDRRMLPSKVEGDLLQAYFDEHQSLPPWNKKA